MTKRLMTKIYVIKHETRTCQNLLPSANYMTVIKQDMTNIIVSITYQFTIKRREEVRQKFNQQTQKTTQIFEYCRRQMNDAKNILRHCNTVLHCYVGIVLR